MELGIHGPNQKYRENPISERAWALMGFLRPAVTALKGFSYWSLSDWARAVEILLPRMVVIRLNHLDDLPQVKALYDSGILGGIDVIIEIWNEPNNAVEGFGSVDDFIARYAQAEMFIRAYLVGWTVCFPGLSPAFSPSWWWEQCQQLIARADYLGLHLYYSQPGNIREQQWHLYAAKALFPNKPILTSEFCYTGGEAGNVRPTSELAPEYGAAAQWLQSEGVAAMFYFILESDDSRWREVGEVFDETLARAVGSIVLNEGEEETSMANWAFTLGFASYAQAHPEVGTPTSDLQYDANGNGLQYTTTGKLEWNKQNNQVLFFRVGAV